MNAVLVNLRIAENLLDWPEDRTEEVLAKFFETGTSDGGVKVDTLEERVNLNRSLGGRGKGTLGTLTSSTEMTNGRDLEKDIVSNKSKKK